MDKYIKDLTTIIRDCSMENTYKMVWIRSLVEFSVKYPQKKNIHFNDLSPFIFKYYWNQTIFFNLNQGPNPIKKPEIHQIVLKEIERYQSKFGYKPIFYTRIQNRVNIDVGKKVYPIYKLDRKNLCLELFHPELLKEYSDILFQLINYKWVQKLEKLNSSPRISKKVNGTDRENIRRGNISKFKDYIDLENPTRRCFISNDILNDDELSIDHVIPWSFLYSDDLWNLVYVKKSENSIKSNRIPSEEMITKLERRNRRLLKILRDNNIKKNFTEELEFSINKDLVRTFWIQCKG